MNTADVSDYQLYQLIQNKKLALPIRQAAEAEFSKRNLSLENVELLHVSHTLKFPDASPAPLPSSCKWLLVLFPFFTTIHSLIAGQLLAKGQPRKWKDYWKYVSLGYLLWTAGVLLYVWFDSFGSA